VSLFCRHGRFTADCSICSKGTVLDQGSATRRRPRQRAAKKAEPARKVFSGPHVATPGYEDGDGQHYVVRLEKVPGGLRLAEWAGSQLRKRAPELPAADLVALALGAGEALDARDAGRLATAVREEPSEAATDGGAGPGAAGAGVSRGRAGDFKEELRVEGLGDGRVRVARWVLRPGSGWELQEAPPMLPAARYAEALADAARRGLLAAAPDRASDPGDAVRLT
jgi:hypothetical protein